jgi:hypothetical protein
MCRESKDSAPLVAALPNFLDDSDGEHPPEMAADRPPVAAAALVYVFFSLFLPIYTICSHFFFCLVVCLAYMCRILILIREDEPAVGPTMVRHSSLEKQWDVLHMHRESVFFYALPAIFYHEDSGRGSKGAVSVNNMTFLPCSSAAARLRSSWLMLLAAPPQYSLLTTADGTCVGLNLEPVRPYKS